MNRLKQAVSNCPGLPIAGASVYTYNTAFVEMASIAGFKALWIEMEHAHLSFREAADLCRIAAGLSMITMIRIPDSRRENVLKACEIGPDILDLPMGNTTDDLNQLVKHARYAPQGERGFFWASRAVGYGMSGSLEEVRANINNSLCLFSQIETAEAVDNADKLCAIQGIDGIFIGPGDLSSSLGLTGKTDHPIVREHIVKAVASAKSAGKLLAMAGPPSYAAYCRELGVDLLFCATDISCMRQGLQRAMSEMQNTD